MIIDEIAPLYPHGPWGRCTIDLLVFPPFLWRKAGWRGGRARDSKSTAPIDRSTTTTKDRRHHSNRFQHSVEKTKNSRDHEQRCSTTDRVGRCSLPPYLPPLLCPNRGHQKAARAEESRSPAYLGRFAVTFIQSFVNFG